MLIKTSLLKFGPKKSSKKIDQYKYPTVIMKLLSIYDKFRSNSMKNLKSLPKVAKIIKLFIQTSSQNLIPSNNIYTNKYSMSTAAFRQVFQIFFVKFPNQCFYFFCIF